MPLRDTVDPKFRKSNTESDEPNRVKPNTDIELPSRHTLRRDIVDPICKKSSTEKDDPNRFRP
jgi:hypothetical protein